MKKLILFLLFFFSVSYAQIVKDVTVYRGDSTYIEFKATGNISAKGITFVVKLTRSFSSPRLIQKRNEIAGGSSSEITASFSAPYTKVRVLLTPNDTQDLTGTIYYYDIIAADVSNLANYFTFSYGKFNLVHDVQTPFDGTDLPENATRITTVSLANGSLQNEYAKWDTTLKAWVPSGMVPGSGSGSEFDSTYIYQALSGKADVNHNHTGVYEPVKGADDNFVTDAEKIKLSNLSGTNTGDQDLSNYASKTATQTFTGLNTFSGNKTVFGTTTNDSVRVSGRLQVNNLGIGSKYNLATGTGFMFSNSTMRQQNFTGASLINHISNFDLDATGADIIWGLAGSSGSGLFTYNLEPYSFGINSLNAQPIYIGTNSFMSLGLFPRKTYMEIDSLKFGSFVNNVFTPVNKITMVADTFNFWGTTYINGTKYAPSGSVANADSLGSLPASAYVTKSAIDGWSTNLYTGSANVMRLGKSYNDKRFNNGIYSDVWNIDYVIPPYNLSANWLYSIEHRTDYFNDTLNTVAHSDIVNIDGTGTPIWRTNDVRIMGNEIAVNVGDLPDSVALNWSLAGLTGNKVILSEANKTAVESRFPMPVRGFEFKFGSVPNYTFPRVYGFFSDLTTNTPSLETAYHFYGQGNYPSYFGGNIYTDGYLRVQDSIIIGTSTVKIYPDSVLVGGVRLAKITEAGSLDTSIVNALIEANEDSSGSAIIGTTETLDSIITAYWNDELGGSTIDTAIVNALIEANEDSSGSAIIGTTETLDSLITDYWNDNLGGGTTWDSTYAYQRITALENDVSALQDTIAYFTNAITSILAALDTCGCSAIVEDNTPPLPPTSYVAVGGTSQTQYVTTWTDPVASDLDSIRWYEGSSADTSAMTWITSIAGGLETYTRTGRTANTTYWSAIKAVDGSGNVSYFSNIDSATTLPTGGVSPFYTIDLEEGNLSEWTSTSGANLTASTTVAHTGTYSMRVGTNSFGNYNFGDKDSVYATFWIYFPSTSSQSATTNYISLFDDGDGDKTTFGSNNSSTTWDQWVVGENSGSLNYFDTPAFTENTWHKIKLYYKRGTGANAVHTAWLNDTQLWTTSSGTAADPTYFIRLGSQVATITNWFYIDDIKLYNSNPGTQD